ncbi:TetR/AcrR family transcriptional regulator [Gracilibacillus sp. S3-1-1]|uniref:TetR/AcrR family transcriptional regulator n=1 Tax=Gracilibacillus pellucidus TaxID=3095368 RepID=A0ACC6M205_9BACI|nr:TetR/AcrR family transcriptional regulator [Gracilibacillus sp. S3-1-1]MDX8044991.1 TetR/AcrR family transcriptional regulator [Gracilibacillus sp. S3-1-1]
MLLFWQNGYEGTSIPALLKAMNISRSSLYDTFTDKQTLYIDALEHYRTIHAKNREILEQATSAKEGINRFFTAHIAKAYDTSLPGGCFVTNAAITVDSAKDKHVNTLIRESFYQLEKAFYTLLQKGQNNGEIDKTTQIKPLATLLLNVNHSINVMAKAGKDKHELEKMISFILDTYL